MTQVWGFWLPPKHLMASLCFQTLGLAREVVIHCCCPPVAPVKWLCSPGDPNCLPSFLDWPVGSQSHWTISRLRVNVSQLQAELLSPGRKVAFVGFEELSSRAETAFPSEGAWGLLCKLSCAGSHDKLRLFVLFCFSSSQRKSNAKAPACLAEPTKSGSSSDKCQLLVAPNKSTTPTLRNWSFNVTAKGTHTHTQTNGALKTHSFWFYHLWVEDFFPQPCCGTLLGPHGHMLDISIYLDDHQTSPCHSGKEWSTGCVLESYLCNADTHETQAGQGWNWEPLWEGFQHKGRLAEAVWTPVNQEKEKWTGRKGKFM